MLYPGAAIISIFLCLGFLAIVYGALDRDGAQKGFQTASSVPAVSSAPKDTTEPNDSTTVSDSEESSFVLGPGTYTVGTDIDSGTYDCVAASGFGVLRGSVAAYGDPGFVQTMGVESDAIECAHGYSNLTLADGDILYIEMSLNVDFQKK